MTTPVDASPRSSLLRAVLVGAAIATLANLALFFAWSAAVAPIMVAREPGSEELIELMPAFVAISCVVPAVVAGGLDALLRRVAPARARAIFVAVSLVFLALSMAPVLEVPTNGLATRVALGLMHVIAAAAIMPPLLRR